MRRPSVAVLFCAIAFTFATPRAAALRPFETLRVVPSRVEGRQTQGVPSSSRDGKRFITETDLFKFTWIAGPQISPGGSTVGLVRVTVNEKENRYESSLFAVPIAASQSSGISNDTPRRLTSGIRDTSPRWAPDGKRIAFVRAAASQSSGGENVGKAQPIQIYVLAMDGGEARPLTELAHGAGAPVWSPDGKVIAFSSPVDDKKGSESRQSADERRAAEGREAQVAGVGPRDTVKEAHKSDVQVV